MAKGIKRQVVAAIKTVREEICVQENATPIGEPYHVEYETGYRDALRDVLTALDGDRVVSRWWSENRG